MKRATVHWFCLSSLLLASCGSEPAVDAPSEGGATEDEAPEPVPEVEMSCRLSSLGFELEGVTSDKNNVISRKVVYEYEGERRVRGVATVEDSEAAETITFNYEQDRLVSCEMSKSKFNQNQGARITYTYDDAGRVTGSDMEGMFPLKTTHTLDDAGRVVAEEVFYAGAPVNTLSYEYDDQGAPVKKTYTNPAGKVTGEEVYRYEDKKNPFIGLGPENAIFDGHPIQNYELLPVAVNRVGDKGELTPDTKTITYNEWGYPLTIVQPSPLPGRTKTWTMSYDCS